MIRSGDRRAGLLLASWLAASVPAPARADPELHLSALVDLRLFSSDAEHGWLDGGLDKLRFVDDDEPVRLGAALLETRARFSPTVSGHATVAAYDGLGAAIDLTEAYVRLAPVPRSPLRIQARLGAFYPPISLENTGVAWTSPYTLSFSAIDSWIGEELRTIGAEVQLTRMGAFRSSAHDFALVASAFRFNDPAGAILSWRGWALHDRQTGLFERIPFAPLPDLLPGGEYYPVQEPYDEPFLELDGRTGWYGGGEWKFLDRFRIRVLHYDNRGDPTVVEKGQWAWRTRFDHVGVQVRAGTNTEILAQAMEGDTRMDGFDGPLVDNRYRSLYGLVTHVRGSHRGSVRYDRFEVLDDDTTPNDPNAERGHAWTAAYFYTPASARLTWLKSGGVRFGAELLRVESRRSARELLGDPEHRRETALQLSAQWRY